MRFASVWLLPFLFALSAAQFGFGGFGDSFNKASNAFQEGARRVASSFPDLSNVRDFSDYIAKTGKSYASAAERQLHEATFAARQQLIDAHNAALSASKKGFELGLNQFADLPFAEFLTKLTGNKKSASGEEKASKQRQAAAPPTTKVPDSFDWRAKGGVTPVKFQGDCGSCWTFASTGAIEGHTFRATGKLPVLSEQNLVDCGPVDYGLNGCDGGYQEYAFAFIQEVQKGVARGDKYPYLDKKDTCKYDPSTKAAQVNGFAAITPKDEKTMKEVVATLGPLACSVNALETLLLYKKGIYADEECNKGEVNHAVLVVGYGSENGKDYWIVKNSWDKNWGEEGYFRLPRGSNFCGIAEECSYPII